MTPPDMSMPPFWVTTKPPSDASAAPLAPPPVSASCSFRPASGHTRKSAPWDTLVTTNVESGHHTGPSPNPIPSTTTSAFTAGFLPSDANKGAGPAPSFRLLVGLLAGR